jgi:hypothetical protein
MLAVVSVLYVISYMPVPAAVDAILRLVYSTYTVKQSHYRSGQGLRDPGG